MKRFLSAVFFSFFSIIFLFSSYAIASETNTNIFIEGKDYEIVSNNPNIPLLPEDKITVTEFFSYGCPWCYQLEPQLQKWLKTKPTNVEFNRTPVIFEKYWDIYAKAFYIATALGIQDKMTPKLFNAIQEQNKTLGTISAMEDFFVAEGVKKDLAQSIFTDSPSLDAEVKQGPQLMQAYQVFVIPAIIIDGKYRTDLRLALDEKKLMRIVSFLVEKRELEKGLKK